jgi:hypothetical protein
MKGGVYAPVAQMMFSFQLGGVVYSHGVRLCRLNQVDP